MLTDSYPWVALDSNRIQTIFDSQQNHSSQKPTPFNSLYYVTASSSKSSAKLLN